MRGHITLLAVTMGLMAPSAHALSTDPLIEGAKLCTRQIPPYERMYGVPAHLISAIASTESGRWHDGLKIAVPWPWTINAEGKGYYFDTKQEAIAMVRKLRAQGVKSMDVGCMQVNLMHHPNAFANIEQAFEPENNIAYGASFLRSLYEERKSWRAAAAAYHSRTPGPGTQYVSRVYDRWYGIIDRIRSARGASAVTPAQMAGGPKTIQPAAEKSTFSSPVQLIRSANASEVQPRPASVSEKIIQVKTVPARDSNLLVTRPDFTRAPETLPPVVARGEPPIPLPASVLPAPKPAANPQAAAMAQVAPSAAPPAIPKPVQVVQAVAPAAPEAKVVRVSPSGQSQVVRSGPRFIFNE